MRASTLQAAVLKYPKAGDTIARAGEPSTHWYGVIQGYLQMYVVNPQGAETTLSCMRKGEWGGEGSLLKKELRQYDLRALTDSRVCLIPLETFDTLRYASIEFNHFLCDIMNARMGEFVGMLAAARLGSPEMQLAKALLMLVDRQGEDLQELALSQHALALISGLSRQRVNMAVSVFNNLGIVRSAPRKGLLQVHVPRLHAHARSELSGAVATLSPSA
ncbi:Crp/Fnr family transcriptional regulator [Variovorax robiniae]|uniref:Crp/Fnr family transcriptional regulator n=1 Tax=Variovorax robiniae TaxID=1836199 RepID=A0ABU8X7W6_9BURK